MTTCNKQPSINKQVYTYLFSLYSFSIQIFQIQLACKIESYTENKLIIFINLQTSPFKMLNTKFDYFGDSLTQQFSIYSMVFWETIILFIYHNYSNIGKYSFDIIEPLNPYKYSAEEHYLKYIDIVC